MSDKLVINLNDEYNTYNDILFECMKINFLSLQEELDVSEQFIIQIANNDEFIECSKEIIIKELNNLNNKFLKNKISELDNEYYLNNKLKTENCGYIKNCYVNGYIEYCNVHKYEHDNLNHEFIFKEYHDAIKEYNSSVKFMLYKEMIVTLSTYMKSFIESYINKHYTRIEKVQTKKEKDFLKSNILSFSKRKCINGKKCFFIKNYDVENFNK